MRINWKILALTFFVVLAVDLVGCRPAIPERRAGIPQTAVWAGGYDGGAWFDCRVDKTRNVNQCSVYGEQSGELLVHADFKLKGLARAATEGELRYDSFDYINRRTISLKEGLVLERVPETSNRK